LPLMNWTSSTIRRSTERNNSLKVMVSFERRARTNWYMNFSAER